MIGYQSNISYYLIPTTVSQELNQTDATYKYGYPYEFALGELLPIELNLNPGITGKLAKFGPMAV